MLPADEELPVWGAHDRDDPFPLLAELRNQAAVHRITLVDGHEAWLVVRHEEALACLRDSRFSKDMHAALADGDDVVAEGLPGPAFARHMLNVDPPDHTRLRRRVAAAFSPRRIEGLRPRTQAIIDDLLDEVASRGPGGPIDLIAAFAFPLPFTIICELLGVPEADRAGLGRSLTGMLIPTITPAAYARAKVASDDLVARLEALVAAKHEDPADDLVSDLIAARDGEEPLTRQELLSTVFQLIVAGHDTTTSLIGNSVVALLRHPEQLEWLRSDPGRIPRALEELLRYDAPVPHTTFRYALEPVGIGGVTIPARSQVLICLASANRDGTRYENPECLQLSRPKVHHLAFGHGIHFCLGAPLARMEGTLALTTLLHRFPQLRLAVSHGELRWDHGDGLVLRGLSELPVVPGPALPRRGTV
jgi:cytochrome P450